MVTAASSADAAVVLVDATKLDWRSPDLALLPQTRRHSLLVHLLRVPSLVFAVNKLDAVAEPELAFVHIKAALERFAQAADIRVAATVPVSALKGWNVVTAHKGWCGYSGPSLLQWLEGLPSTPHDTALPMALPVQWVEKFSSSADTSQGRRVFWGRLGAGQLQVGQSVQIFPSGQTALVAQVLDHARRPGEVSAGHSAGVVLDREVDVSRGDWILAASAAAPVADDDFDAEEAAPVGRRDLTATVAWMDDEPLVPGRVYLALHGHRWVKAKVRRVVHHLDIHTLAEEPAANLQANAIGVVELALQEPLPLRPFTEARIQGALILVDTASHKTAAAALAH
jgi:sulfate adenylyltransferase subunit 1